MTVIFDWPRVPLSCGYVDSTMFWAPTGIRRAAGGPPQLTCSRAAVSCTSSPPSSPQMSDNGKKRRNGPPGGEGGPKKKKSHYTQTGRPSDKAIPVGATGLLVTCDSGREFKAYDEMMRLLEESFQRLGKDHVGRTTSQPAAAADNAAGDDTAAAADGAAGAAAEDTAEDTAAAAAPAAAAGGGDKPRSISDMLAAEVADLKKERVHRFKRHNTDVRGTVFVEFPKVDECPSPESVALDIAQHVKTTRSLPARFVLRLLPVTLTCFASKEELQAITPHMVQRYFAVEGDQAKEAIDFAVEYEHRSSDKLKRPDVIDIVAKAVPQPPYKVSLTMPSRTILVQVVRNVAAISVVSSFKQLAKYNLRRLVEEEEQEGAKQDAAAAAPAADKEEGDGKAEAATAEATAAAAAAEGAEDKE